MARNNISRQSKFVQKSVQWVPWPGPAQPERRTELAELSGRALRLSLRGVESSLVVLVSWACLVVTGLEMPANDTYHRLILKFKTLNNFYGRIGGRGTVRNKCCTTGQNRAGFPKF